MEEYYQIKMPGKSLEAYGVRICRGNLKKPMKVCKETCPIIYPVIQIMNEITGSTAKKF